MEKVNVYDFDKTMIPYDSTEAFFKFCIRRHPRAALAALPAVPHVPVMLLRPEYKTRVKEIFYHFLTALPQVDDEVDAFWQGHYADINGWYMAQKRSDDIISSASPEFLLKPVADRLGVRLIASRVDKHTGSTLGMNNHGEEKVRRLHELYPGLEIADFYSDSLSDSPLARIADRAFMVADQLVTPWPKL